MKKRTSVRRWWCLAAFAALLTACVVWITIDDLFSPLDGDGVRVEIPDFRGQVYADLEIADWMDVEVEYAYDALVPQGTVLSQEPVAGSLRKLNAGRTTVELWLTVSRGQEMLAVPNLVGMDLREAEARLREMGLAVRTVRVQSAHLEGRVLSTEPAATMPIAKGGEVLLTVSMGTPSMVVTVPDLRGLSLADARIRLWISRLTLGDVVTESSDEPKGCVIRQSHQAGTRVKASTSITIYVSGGKPSQE